MASCRPRRNASRSRRVAKSDSSRISDGAATLSIRSLNVSLPLSFRARAGLRIPALGGANHRQLGFPALRAPRPRACREPLPFLPSASGSRSRRWTGACGIPRGCPPRPPPTEPESLLAECQRPALQRARRGIRPGKDRDLPARRVEARHPRSGGADFQPQSPVRWEAYLAARPAKELHPFCLDPAEPRQERLIRKEARIIQKNYPQRPGCSILWKTLICSSIGIAQFCRGEPSVREIGGERVARCQVRRQLRKLRPKLRRNSARKRLGLALQGASASSLGSNDYVGAPSVTGR